jgi:hypothetical protein
MFTAQAVKHNHLDGGKDRKEFFVMKNKFIFGVLALALTLAACGGGGGGGVPNSVWEGSGEIEGYTLIFQDGRAFFALVERSDAVEETYSFSGGTGTFDEFGWSENVRFTINGSTLTMTDEGESVSFVRVEKPARSSFDGIWSNKDGQTAVFANGITLALNDLYGEAAAFTATGSTGKIGDEADLSIKGNTLTMSIGGDSISFTRGFTADKNVDKFLKDYEAVVVSLEKAAESKNAVDLAKLGLKATELYSKSEKVIADESKWTAVQLKKLEALVKRAAGAAMNAASGIEIPEF